MSERFSSILRPELAELVAYAPEQGSFDVRLDANESPSYLSDAARARIAEALVPPALNRYPDARMTDLRRAIAERMRADVDEVIAGIGSDEVIAMILTALSRPRDRAPSPTIVTPSPTFVMYRVSGRGRGFKVVEVPLDATWDLDVGGTLRAIEFARPNVVFLATPNNPTSGRLSRDRLERVVEAASDAFVVVDEAYVDFASGTDADLRAKYPNVGVLRTISKVGFASLRCGYLVAPAELVREIDKVRQPYSMPTPTQRAATVVLRELSDEVAKAAEKVVVERERLAARLVALGFDVPRSETNFLWVGCRGSAGDVAARLAERGVLVRSFHKSGGRLGARMRVTVGLPHENDRLLQELARCA